MIKIVILDGYTLNPGDLSWTELERLGDVTVYDRTEPAEVVDRLKDADIALTNKTPITGDAIAELPQLKWIGVLATGYNIIDIDAARQRNIPVSNVPGYSTHSVAQLVFAFIFSLYQKVDAHDVAVQRGEWTSCPDFSFTVGSLQELHGKKLGIIGFGAIGQQVAKIGAAFGMEILVSSRSGPRRVSGLEFVQWCSVEELLKSADIVTLHCPQTEETTGMINRHTLKQMKPNSILINTARGGLVVEEDLAEALSVGNIAGAGLDVLSTEPPASDHPLIGLQNCVVTPHIGWATLEARKRLLAITIENIQAFQEGAPIHVVN